MKTVRISVAKDFSKVPAGRYSGDGSFSGQKFREDYLVPALRSGATVVVDLAGVAGYGSSFLEEAFGGLVRKEGFERDFVERRVVLEASDRAFRPYVGLARQYVERAEPE